MGFVVGARARQHVCVLQQCLRNERRVPERLRVGDRSRRDRSRLLASLGESQRTRARELVADLVDPRIGAWPIERAADRRIGERSRGVPQGEISAVLGPQQLDDDAKLLALLTETRRGRVVARLRDAELVALGEPAIDEAGEIVGRRRTAGPRRGHGMRGLGIPGS